MLTREWIHYILGAVRWWTAESPSIWKSRFKCWNTFSRGN